MAHEGCTDCASLIAQEIHEIKGRLYCGPCHGVRRVAVGLVIESLEDESTEQIKTLGAILSIDKG